MDQKYSIENLLQTIGQLHVEHLHSQRQLAQQVTLLQENAKEIAKLKSEIAAAYKQASTKDTPIE